MKRLLSTVNYLLIFLHLSIVVTQAGEKVFYYHTDPAGTPMAMTDSSGKVVWRADYRPFGEEQSIAGTVDNNKQFIGKEKDRETGLHSVGVRYMDDKIGRFISPDPIGPVDPWTSKANEKPLLNPQKLNRYAYALNNPYRYIDPDGKWAEDVHSGIGNTKGYGTYTWAKQAGFSDKEARIIARGNNATDSGPWTSWLPALGDQSRHFNQTGSFANGVGDSRDYWANLELERAVKYMKKGDCEAALGHLGKGLHSLQDKDAHRDWNTGLSGSSRHPGWYDDWHGAS